MRGLLISAAAAALVLTGCSGGASEGDVAACSDALTAVHTFSLMSAYGQDDSQYSLELHDELLQASNAADHEPLRDHLFDVALAEAGRIGLPERVRSADFDELSRLCEEDLGLECGLHVGGGSMACRS